MDVLRDSDGGHWLVEATDEERELKADYLDALPRYLNAFDPLLARAQAADEFQFIVALLGTFGMQAVGWIPYETTIEAVRSATKLYNENDDVIAGRHLRLWLYGHIVEASAPYDLLANALQIARGEQARPTWFPDENGRVVGPGAKIQRIGQWAESRGHAGIGELMGELWDRDLRNAVFHSDYALHGAEVRLPAAGVVRSREELDLITGRATAYHDAMVGVRSYYIQSYTEPKRISAASFAHDPDEEAVVIVREGDGAVGLKDGFSPEQVAAGAIRFRLAKLYPGEAQMLDSHPDLALLPGRPNASRSSGPPRWKRLVSPRSWLAGRRRV
jgi:hypothetical protein